MLRVITVHAAKCRSKWDDKHQTITCILTQSSILLYLLCDTILQLCAELALLIFNYACQILGNSNATNTWLSWKLHYWAHPACLLPSFSPISHLTFNLPAYAPTKFYKNPLHQASPPHNFTVSKLLCCCVVFNENFTFAKSIQYWNDECNDVHILNFARRLKTLPSETCNNGTSSPIQEADSAESYYFSPALVRL